MAGDFEIRPYKPEDYDAVIKIFRRTRMGYVWPFYRWTLDGSNKRMVIQHLVVHAFILWKCSSLNMGIAMCAVYHLSLLALMYLFFESYVR